MTNENLTPVLISGVSCYERDGTAYLRLEDVARGLGFTKKAGSTAGSSGYGSTAAATGVYCRAKADGKDNIAVANGYESKARGAMGCYLVLTEYDDGGHMLFAKMEQVDGKSIKENVWYTLKNGEFVEAEP